MAATHQSIELTPLDWTQVTTADVSSAALQNKTGYGILVLATAGATKPATTPAVLATAYEYLPNAGFDATRTLAEMFPGITGANRLWVYTPMGGRVVCSHA